MHSSLHSPLPPIGGPMSHPGFRRWSAIAGLATAVLSVPAFAQQKQDAEYTAKIKEYLTDPRITTELVDHLPASDKVPTPLKFLGHIAGQPGYLDYAKDIHAYLKA